MDKNFEKELHRAEREKNWAKRADSFWSSFQMTENGHVKSTLLLNSFCLMILLLVVYGAAFYLLADPIHAWLSGGSLLLEGVVSALLPALVGTAVCGLFYLVCLPQTVLAAYLWLLVLSLACLVTMLILLWGESGAIRLFLQLFATLIPAPVLCGILSALWVLRRKQRAL